MNVLELGAAPLFSSPEDPQKPISRHLADAWLREAENSPSWTLRKEVSGTLSTQMGHREEASPDVDVAAAGGWKDTVSLKTAYQQADDETMLRVVLEAGELREAK